MKIRFQKGKEGKATIVWMRDAGTREVFRASAFFVSHDLTHYAVETNLGLKNAFYGLMAQGWEIEDFGRKDPITNKTLPLPLEAGIAEAIVGLIQLEQGGRLTPKDTATIIEEERAKGGYADIPLTEASLNTIRETANNLIAQWEALEADSFFDLDFEG